MDYINSDRLRRAVLVGAPGETPAETWLAENTLKAWRWRMRFWTERDRQTEAAFWLNKPMPD